MSNKEDISSNEDNNFINTFSNLNIISNSILDDEDEDDEQPDYVNTLEYEVSIRMIEKHNRFITYKTIKNMKMNTFIKYIYKNKQYDKYLNIDELLSKTLKNNILIEINEYLDCKSKIKFILLPEFIFNKNNSPFENNDKLIKINDKSKPNINKDEINFIDDLVLKRIIFNLYMYKFNKRNNIIKKNFFI